MSDLITVPVIATDSTYDAGTDPWSGGVNKIAPAPSLLAKGAIPGQPVAAEDFNYLMNASALAGQDAQIVATVRRASSFADAAATGFPVFLDATGAFAFIHNTAAGAGGYLLEASPDFVRTKTSASNAQNYYDTIIAEYCANAGQAVFVCADATQQGKIITQADGPTLAATYDTIPAAANSITDIIRDPNTGFCYLLSHTQSMTLSGAIIGGSSFAWVAIGGGWSTTEAVGAARGAAGAVTAEVRLWDLANAWKTTASTNNGAAWSTPVTTTWDGSATPPGGSPQQLPPAWDRINARYICAAVDFTSSATLLTSGRLYTSPDGIAWTTLVTTPGYVFVSIAEQRGWLWALVSMNAAHGGLEIMVSRDGGATWMRTGGVVSLTPLTNTTAMIRQSKIRRAGPSHVVAFTTVSGSLECVVVQCGVG